MKPRPHLLLLEEPLVLHLLEVGLEETLFLVEVVLEFAVVERARPSAILLEALNSLHTPRSAAPCFS
jgi:hypothetical protein